MHRQWQREGSSALFSDGDKDNGGARGTVRDNVVAGVRYLARDF